MLRKELGRSDTHQTCHQHGWKQQQISGKKRFDKPESNNCLKMARFHPYHYSWVRGGWSHFQHLFCPKRQWTGGSSREQNQGGQLSRGLAQMNAFHVVLWRQIHSLKRVSSLPIFTKLITNKWLQRLLHWACNGMIETWGVSLLMFRNMLKKNHP